MSIGDDCDSEPEEHRRPAPTVEVESAGAAVKSSFDEQLMAMQSAQRLCRTFSVVNVHNMQQDQHAMSVRTHSEHHHERHFSRLLGLRLFADCFLFFTSPLRWTWLDLGLLSFVLRSFLLVR